MVTFLATYLATGVQVPYFTIMLLVMLQLRPHSLQASKLHQPPETQLY